MSYGWGPDLHQSRRRVREEVVRDVVERGLSSVGAAATWGIPVADVEQWVEDARVDAQTAS